MENYQPSDVQVYRDSSGGAAVTPGVFYVDRRVKHTVDFKNFVADSSAVVNIRSDEFTLNKFGEPGDCYSFDVTGLPKGTIHYRVTVGPNVARGNSAPALIIDG